MVAQFFESIKRKFTRTICMSKKDHSNIYWNYPPPPRMPVTTRMIPFLVGDPYRAGTAPHLGSENTSSLETLCSLRPPNDSQGLFQVFAVSESLEVCEIPSALRMFWTTSQISSSTNPGKKAMIYSISMGTIWKGTKELKKKQNKRPKHSPQPTTNTKQTKHPKTHIEKQWNHQKPHKTHLKTHVTNCIPARLFAPGSFGWSFADPSHHDKGQHAKTIEIHRVAVLSYGFFGEKSDF